MKRYLGWGFGVVGAIVAVWFFVAQVQRQPFTPLPPMAEGLEVMTTAPRGEEIPITADGITVMFNRPIIALTTLDKGRDQKIPIEITPKVKGKFFWLGTSGFIFRPKEPFPPSTQYQVTLPTAIRSIDGHQLQKPVQWEFQTVRPRVIEEARADILLPSQAAYYLRFNVAMDHASVAQALAITTKAGAILDIPLELHWQDHDHFLFIRMTKDLPWDTEMTLRLAAGVKGKVGDLGLAEAFTTTFATPKSTLTVEKVSLGVIDALVPGTTAEVDPGSGACYHFSQPITTESFAKAFQLKNAQGKTPYYYFHYQEQFAVPDAKGELDWVEGYRLGCASFMEEYDTAYAFTIDSTQVVAVSGAELKATADLYTVHTGNAGAMLSTTLTKHLLSQRGQLALPFNVRNLSAMQLAIYPLPSSDYFSEGITNNELSLAQHLVPETKLWVPDNDPPMSRPLYGTSVPLPYDVHRMGIDQARMTPRWTERIPIQAPKNQRQQLWIDLEQIAGTTPEPGFYLLEAVAIPSDAGATLERPTYTAVQISPIALAVKRDVDHLLIWATDIETGAPVANLPLSATRWHDRASHNQQSGMTNADGVLILKGAWSGRDVPLEYEHGEVCVEVTDPARFAYSCDADHRLTPDLWARDLLSHDPHYFTYLYTDRPIYRPGQTVYFSSFTRRVKEGRYFQPEEALEVTVSVSDAVGNDLFSKTAKLTDGGVFHDAFTLEDREDLPRGQYAITVEAGFQRATRHFYVASYRKPSFKVDLTAKHPEIISKSPIDVAVEGAYFFGAPMRKSALQWSIMTRTYDFSPEGYAPFTFLDSDLLQDRGDDDYYSDFEYDIVASSDRDEDDSWYDDPRGGGTSRGASSFYKGADAQDMSLVNDQLDALGRFAIHYRPDLSTYPTSQRLSVEANVTDPTNQEVSGGVDVVVHKADFYLGIRPEQWAYGEQETATFPVVSLDTQGQPKGKQRFTAEILKREYEWIEQRNAQGNWDVRYESKDTVLKTLDGKTDGEGNASLTFDIPGGGTYRVRLKGRDGEGNDVQTATQIEAWGEGYVPWRLGKPEQLAMVPDKKVYQVGDTARVLVKSLVPVTKALLTFDRGRVLEYRVVALGGNATHFEIPITEGLIPNFFVSVVAHVGREGKRPPMLFHGEVELLVAPEQKRLKVEVTPDRTGVGDGLPIYRPGDEVTVKLRATDPSGQPVKTHLAVSVADESVLRLLDYQLPDLVEKFFYNRQSGVETSSSLLSLKAGDAGDPQGKKRRIFKDTAHYVGDVATDANGEADFHFTLPDDLTTWVIEAVGVSNSKTMAAWEEERLRVASARPQGQRALGTDLVITDGTFVGSARAKVMTTLPLLLRTALPRFAAWGDRIQGKVIATNRNPEARQGTIVLSVSGSGAFDGKQTTLELPLAVEGHGETEIPFTIDVSNAGKHLTFAASAFSPEGLAIDVLEVNRPVVDRYAPEVVATSGMTQDAVMEELAIPDGLPLDRGGLTVGFKASLGLASLGPLRDLIHFPYGCAEQKSSSLLALMMARHLSEQLGEPYFDALFVGGLSTLPTEGMDAKRRALDAMIGAGITDLAENHQESAGGFRYWPDSDRADFFASAQVAWAFDMARDFALPIAAWRLERLQEYLRSELATRVIRYSESLGVIGKGQASQWDVHRLREEMAYGLWALARLGGWHENAAAMVGQSRAELSASGLAYLLMALKEHFSATEGTTEIQQIQDQLVARAQHQPRHVLWPASDVFWSDEAKSTALAAVALLAHNPRNPLITKAFAFLLNQKRSLGRVITQQRLHLAWALYSLAQTMQEASADFTAELTLGEMPVASKTFGPDNLLEIFQTTIPMEDLVKLPRPTPMRVGLTGQGTLYYDLELQYYLPPEQTPTREEGLIIARDYYDLDDVDEQTPLTTFSVGKNYKGHITVIVPQSLNYVLIHEPLPAGFEPIDMSLATSSRAAAIQAQQGGDEVEWKRGSGYDDEVHVQDYGMDYGFHHQEIRDDALIWSDTYLPAGVYHVRYPIRATTAGEYLMSGATAFEFYEPEIFGRSRMQRITIH